MGKSRHPQIFSGSQKALSLNVMWKYVDVGMYACTYVHVCKYVTMYLSVYVSVRPVSLVCLCDCVSVCLYVRVGDDAGSRAWVCRVFGLQSQHTLDTRRSRRA